MTKEINGKAYNMIEVPSNRNKCGLCDLFQEDEATCDGVDCEEYYYTKIKKVEVEDD